MKSKSTIPERPDYWREDFRCYASQWGYRCGSEIAKLIDYIREEYRVKYGCDYRLRRIGKNRFEAIPGKDGSVYGISYAVEASKKFRTTVTCEVINENQD
jgi:hypothetical protein